MRGWDKGEGSRSNPGSAGANAQIPKGGTRVTPELYQISFGSKQGSATDFLADSAKVNRLGKRVCVVTRSYLALLPSWQATPSLAKRDPSTPSRARENRGKFQSARDLPEAGRLRSG